MPPNKIDSLNQQYYHNHYGDGYSPTTQYNNNAMGTTYSPSSPTTNSSMGSPGPGGFSCVNLHTNQQQQDYPGQQPGYPPYNGVSYQQLPPQQQHSYQQPPPQQPHSPPPQQRPPPNMGPGGFVLPLMNPNNNAYPPQQLFGQPSPMGTPQFSSAQYPPSRFY